MQASDAVVMTMPKQNDAQQRIASWGHLVGFLAIMAGMVGMGFWATACRRK
jgi:hypothetical protein